MSVPVIEIVEGVVEGVAALVALARAAGASEQTIDEAIAKGRARRKAQIAADRAEEILEFSGGEGVTSASGPALPIDGSHR